jgi:hypothetical protein
MFRSKIGLIAWESFKSTGLLNQLFFMYFLQFLRAGVLSYFDTQVEFLLSNTAKNGDFESHSYWLIVSLIILLLIIIANTISIFNNGIINVYLKTDIVSTIFKRASVGENLENLMFYEDVPANVNAASAAATSIMYCVRISANMLNVFLTIITVTISITTQIGPIVFPYMINLFLLCMIGLQMQATFNKKQKKIEKDTNPIQSTITDLSKGIIASMINGNHEIDLQTVTNLINKKDILSSTLLAEIRFKNRCLQALTAISVTGYVLFIMYMNPDIDLVTLYVINGKLILLGHRIWDAFHMITDVQTQIAKFGPCELMLENIEKSVDKYEHIDAPIYRQDTFLNDLFNAAASLKTEIIELPCMIPGSLIHLSGPRGKGKTTFMKRCLMQWVHWSRLDKGVGFPEYVRVIYVPQIPSIEMKGKTFNLFAFFSKSSRSSSSSSSNFSWKSYFQTNELEKELELELELLSKKEIDTIIKLAKRLNMDNNADDAGSAIIDENNELKKEMTGPSPGTIKLLVFIQAVFKIILLIEEGENVAGTYLFLDEALAGLDNDSRIRLNAVSKELLQNGVTIVVIDHVEFTQTHEIPVLMTNGETLNTIAPLQETVINGKMYPLIVKSDILKLGIKSEKTPSTFDYKENKNESHWFNPNNYKSLPLEEDKGKEQKHPPKVMPCLKNEK